MHSNDPAKNLASALGRIPSGMFIITMAQGDIETGMLASWVQQCSFRPPMITFVVQRGRPIADMLAKDAVFTVNILESAQTDMIAHFGKGFGPQDTPFKDLEVQREPPHGPILTESHAYLFGKIVDRLSLSDHDLFVAEVTAGSVLDEGQPMVHIRKNGLHY